ncbi:unnamed protein product [Dibothriocephalus latus]|uniref:Uncharacterized protein n=1 Tax=Dibothriocephalus latus TaxID=60516 RepID=A0A3P7LMQ2_DIBLA|nr:unnamed protein product [Dibothriocephalus latus]
MFYGTSFFKKSTASPQIKNDLPNHVTQGNTGSAKNALWDVICDSDLNSSSDLDDSMEYFYSRSSLFKNRSDANESKLSSTSGPQKWKSKFFNEPPRESPKVNQSMDSIEDCEPAPSSPALKYTIGQAKSGGFQKMSSFGQSPVYKSPVVTTSSGRAEKDFSLRGFSTRKSPSLQKKTDDENLAEPELTVYEEDDEGEKEEAPQASNEIVEERKIPAPTPSVDRASDSIRLERLPLLQLKLKNEAIKLENWKNELVSNLQKKEKLVKAEIESSEKDIRIEEAHRKCSQLTDDLRHVYELLQASKRENTERTQAVSCLQETVSKLELEKGHLEEMVNKLEVEHSNTMTIYEEAMQSLKSKTADSLLALILMVSESNELMKSYEQSEGKVFSLTIMAWSLVNLKMCLMKTELEIETVKCREKDLSQRITEMKNEELAKSQKINEISTVLQNCKNENEKLRMEADNGAKALKELDEAYKTLDSTLIQTLQKQEELKENYATLESHCQEQETTLAKENIKAAKQAAYVDKLVKQVESLEKERTQLKAKLQDSKKHAEVKNTKVEELESQLQERLRQLEELRETVRMSDTEKAEIEKSARENLASVASKEAENAQLTERLQLADAERMAAIKRNDEIRAELLYAMEQQQQEMDKLLRLKDRELENLRSTLATQQNDSEKNVKKTEKKIAESGTQIEKLTKQLRECTQEKVMISSQQFVSS